MTSQPVISTDPRTTFVCTPRDSLGTEGINKSWMHHENPGGGSDHWQTVSCAGDFAIGGMGK